MRLNIKAMAFTLGILWGAIVLLTGLANLIWSGYGTGFLQILASVYPGYKASGSVGLTSEVKREAGVHYPPIEPQA
ncbi:MAG: hypothetical protein P8175_11725 [Deltaproteobacteria bacterium]